MKVSKHAVMVNKFIKKLMSIGKPDVRGKNFKDYYII